MVRFDGRNNQGPRSADISVRLKDTGEESSHSEFTHPTPFSTQGMETEIPEWEARERIKGDVRIRGVRIR